MSICFRKFIRPPGGGARKASGSGGINGGVGETAPRRRGIGTEKTPALWRGFSGSGLSPVRSLRSRLLRLSGDTACAALSLSVHLRAITAGGDTVPKAAREFFAGPSDDGRGVLAALELV